MIEARFLAPSKTEKLFFCICIFAAIIEKRRRIFKASLNLHAREEKRRNAKPVVGILEISVLAFSNP